MSLRSLVSRHLAPVRPYSPSEPPGIRVRLNANEAPPNDSPELLNLIARAVESVRPESYPAASMGQLKGSIARHVGVRPSEIVIGAGSDEVIGFLCCALSEARPEATQPVTLVPDPTFVMYATTAIVHGHQVVSVPLTPAWGLDVLAMLEAVKAHRPSLIFIASPNNPTGNAFCRDDLIAIIEAARDSLVVIDEAYGDYAEGSVRDLRSVYDNVAVLRTLSKVGLAALRVGWVEAPEWLCSELEKVRPPFNVSAYSQAVAAAVLGEGFRFVAPHLSRVRNERARVAERLSRLPGFEVVPSQANFLWVKADPDAKRAYDTLVARGILVRSFGATAGRLAEYLRITVGSAEENDALLAALGA